MIFVDRSALAERMCKEYRQKLDNINKDQVWQLTSITRATFAQMFSLKRTTAYLRLKELEQMGVIQAVGRGKETKYIKKVTILEKDHGNLR